MAALRHGLPNPSAFPVPNASNLLYLLDPAPFELLGYSGSSRWISRSARRRHCAGGDISQIQIRPTRRELEHSACAVIQDEPPSDVQWDLAHAIQVKRSTEEWCILLGHLKLQERSQRVC